MCLIHNEKNKKEVRMGYSPVREDTNIATNSHNIVVGSSGAEVPPVARTAEEACPIDPRSLDWGFIRGRDSPLGLDSGLSGGVDTGRGCDGSSTPRSSSSGTTRGRRERSAGCCGKRRN
jgi:hypothetical protein